MDVNLMLQRDIEIVLAHVRAANLLFISLQILLP